MPDPGDLLKAWQHAIRDLGARGGTPDEPARKLAGLLDQQADLLERAGTLMRDPLTAFRPADDEVHAETGDATGPHTL